MIFKYPWPGNIVSNLCSVEDTLLFLFVIELQGLTVFRNIDIAWRTSLCCDVLAVSPVFLSFLIPFVYFLFYDSCQ